MAAALQRRTQVDPEGLAQLYLPTLEIPQFFEACLNYYDYKQQQNQKRFRITLSIYLSLGLIAILWLFSEFAISDDDEVGLFIFFGILFVIGLIVVFAVFGSKKNKYLKQHGKGQMLAYFFAKLQHDLHPESGLKGIIDHGKHQEKHRYKSKTSPHSGSKKHYYKYPWAVLKFTLIDGTSVRLKCVDKLKEKGGSLVRFQEIQKGRVLPNDLIYEVEPGLILNFRNDLSFAENDLRHNAETLGVKMLDNFKHFYSHLRRHTNLPKSPAVKTTETSQPKQSSKAQTSKEPQPEKKVLPTLSSNQKRLSKLKTLLASSEIEMQVKELGEGLEIRFTPSGQSTPTILWLETGKFAGETFATVRLGIQGQSPEAVRLLRANPSLAYGRFAYHTPLRSGQKQLCLIKTMLWETLDREELETAITGLATLGSKLGALKELPQKAKAYRAERHPQWEKMLLENALLGVPVDIEPGDKKFKLRLSLKQGRFQTVHVRFDRQDLEGNQLISLMSYCGHQDKELYQTVLEENSHWSYGAVGLATLGIDEMFVVSDNQLADTADPPELRTAILQIADKADQLEALLSGGSDVH